MITAKCNRCGGTAFGNTFEEASKKINHAVGLSRGIKCGDNYGNVVEDSTPKVEKPKEPTPTEPKESIPVEKPKESTVDTKPKSTKSKFKK